PAPQADRLPKFLADLNSPVFKVRETAIKEFAEAGDLAGTALDALWKKPPSTETQQRVRKLLDDLARKPTPADLRISRAVQALELADTEQARAVLRALAAGGRGARLTDAAAAALTRWQTRLTWP